MKLISVISFLVLTACAHQSPSRVPTGRYAETRIEIYKVGEIKTSLLTAEKFQAEYGSVWRLMNGEDLGKSSEFEFMTGMSKLPDARGKFLRMLNNGATGEAFDPDKNRRMGSEQMDSIKKHNHLYSGSEFHKWGTNGEAYTRNNGADAGRIGFTSETGEAETRPKNISVNFYVKIASCPENEPNCL